MILEVTDDSGFLALVDPDAYESFVAEDWSLEQLIEHFKGEMAQGRLLIWGTGREDTWRVGIEMNRVERKPYREVSGPLTSVQGRLLLTNYESLSMAAQFQTVSLPEAHQSYLLLKVAPGSYTCRVIQFTDPDQESDDGREIDFAIQLQRGDGTPQPWRAIPWFAA